ncbi:hypothetical protein T492DRAFT_913243 [Pavlovales sp. CCMP2436]|nr:hypothetical protein T492DRAFT_913243 [Pavlovales sp. CCMP2436]
MQQQPPAAAPVATIILRRALHGQLARALTEAFAPARLVAGADDLPADCILPGGTGVLLLQPAAAGYDGAMSVLDVPRAQRIAQGFKHPVICCSSELLNRAVLELLDAQLLERFTVLPFGCAEGLALSMAEHAELKDPSDLLAESSLQRVLEEMHDELAAKMGEGSGVALEDARALLYAVPLDQLLSAPLPSLTDLSPLLPRATVAIHRWLTAHGDEPRDELRQAAPGPRTW